MIVVATPDGPLLAKEGQTRRSPADRRPVVAWVLYDVGNSAFAAVVMATVFPAYFALTVVGNERGEGDLWWGRLVSLSMAIVAVLAPVLGAIADRAGIRRPLFVGFTLLAVVATALLATVEPGMLLWGFLLGVLGNTGFEGALVYYNAWLPELAPSGHQGRLSAWGFAAGYAGSLAALLVALSFLWAGNLGGAFLAAAVLFGGFALPAFVLLPTPRSEGIPVREALRAGAGEVLTGIRTILAHRDLRRFFGAYLVYEDGVNTVIAFSAIFAAQTLGVPFDRLIVLYIVVQLSALLGALAWARPIDRLGPRRVVMITLAQWVGVAIAAALVQSQVQFYGLAVVAGSGLGAVQAASRALLAGLVPPGQEARLFGFYALCGKSAAILGPLVFGAVSHAAGGDQRLGVLTVGLFFVVGLALLARVRSGGPRTAGPEGEP
jgi:UMF1 family MFS transporter